MRRFIVLGVVVVSSVGLSSCTSAPAVSPFVITPRVAGVRAPLTGDCDPLDDTHCLLPWPSSTFLTADPDTATGVRVAVSAASLDPDDVANVWGADGFSRSTSILTGLEGAVDPESVASPPTDVGGALRLFVATPEHPHYGEEVPLRLESIVEFRGVAHTLVKGDPLEMLEPATDYVAVLTDAVRMADGQAVTVPRETRVALGLEQPASEAEAALAGYHAPTVALLDDVGIDRAHVLRAWDFTTRSEDDPRRLLLAVRDASLAALERGEIAFVVDAVEHRESGDIASIVRGHITGLPNFVGESLDLTLDAHGVPQAEGLDESPFRVMIPRGEGDYRTVLFGHGAGGSANDGTFDDALAAEDIGKVGMELTGFHGDVLVETIEGLADRLFVGIRHAVAQLLQAIAQAVVIERALSGPLGDVLAAETLGGEPNPHAGRRPGLDGVPWVGGSLGGITGLVVTSVDPDIHHAVLNVPACGWSQWVEDSVLYAIAQFGVRRENGGEIGAAIGLAIAQTEIDALDGASFVELARADGDVFLVQESMGDNVVPNAGTEYLAIVTGADMVGAALSPIHGIDEVTQAVDHSAITQFRAEQTDLGAVHGFAAENHPSGHAAIEQIQDFLSSAWDGHPTIHVPSQCPSGVCDFLEE
ncbi:MAG: hypothetical protein K1X94_34690 [Sandaracinaceae bacterium]|nr:hypothetical protein [Sandaracinaceae bacterium]